ncbi:TIGR03089 family protein [Brachybacterium huguangmaarense]
MTPVSPSGDAAARLLRALEERGPRPALVWYAEEGRTELSGHVLANWVIKSIGHLADDVGLVAGDDLVLDLPPHFKRLVLALAGWSLGLSVRIVDDATDAAGLADGGGGTLAVATDRPDSAQAGAADEVLALEARALSLAFGGELPPLARDWAQEMRGSSDRLTARLGPWSGPDPVDAPGSGAVLADSDGAAVTADAASVLGALLVGRTVVGPSGSVDAAAARSEGVIG